MPKAVPNTAFQKPQPKGAPLWVPRRLAGLVVVLSGLVGSAGALAEEPALPSGLGSGSGESSEPALPSGLGGSEPSLPSGLGGTPSEPVKTKAATSSAWDQFDFGGFYEMRYGRRTDAFADYKITTLGEARFQGDVTWSGDWATIKVTADGLLDTVLDEKTIDLETGRGWIDLREASILLRPLENLDVKVGRQILTWGTGDLLFINDLFPKDWNAFFIGRDEEYLKGPSDAVKASVYVGGITLDTVFTPRMDPDRYIDGRRLTYFDPLMGDLRQTPASYAVERREEWGDDAEVAVRISGQMKSAEWALYGYTGAWKSPVGFDPLTGKNTFPDLNVYGASLRAPLLGGIGNAEIGYYDSSESGAATSPFLPNSEWRALVGFEREIITDLTGAAQVYVEKMEDYGAYEASLPPGMPQKDELRTLVTVRLTQMLMNQNLTLSVFSFWSPTDEDGYLRLKATYKIDDQWTIEGGGNVFYGAEKTSFFGQFQDNTNLFVSLRMSF